MRCIINDPCLIKISRKYVFNHEMSNSGCCFECDVWNLLRADIGMFVLIFVFSSIHHGSPPIPVRIIAARRLSFGDVLLRCTSGPQCNTPIVSQAGTFYAIVQRHC
jgi:hypothetical protein